MFNSDIHFKKLFTDKMNNAMCKGLRSPMRTLANLRRAKAISTSIVHNETILVKNNEEFVNKVSFLIGATTNIKLKLLDTKTYSSSPLGHG